MRCCFRSQLGHWVGLWWDTGLSLLVGRADGEEATGGAGRVTHWIRQACTLPAPKPGYKLVPTQKGNQSDRLQISTQIYLSCIKPLCSFLPAGTYRVTFLTGPVFNKQFLSLKKYRFLLQEVTVYQLQRFMQCLAGNGLCPSVSF